MKGRILTLSLFLFASLGQAQVLGELNVDKIMRDPQWIGTAPSNVRWSLDGKTIYFTWNPENALSDSLYKIVPPAKTPQKVSKQERMSLPSPFGTYNKTYTKFLYEKNGDIFLHDIVTNRTTQITKTSVRESAPTFSGDEKKILYVEDQNIYSWELGSGLVEQLTDFKKGKKNSPPPASEQDKWLRQDQLATLSILKERDDKQQAGRVIQKSEQPKRPKEIYTEDKNVEQARLSPDGKFVTFRLTKNSSTKSTIVPNYVTTSGYTEDISARTKVAN